MEFINIITIGTTQVSWKNISGSFKYICQDIPPTRVPSQQGILCCLSKILGL